MYIPLRVEKSEHSFGRKSLAPYSFPLHARIPPLVTISMALDIHEVTGQSWIRASDCSILAVNNGLLTSSLLYVSAEGAQAVAQSSVCIHCQLTNNHKTSSCLMQ